MTLNSLKKFDEFYVDFIPPGMNIELFPGIKYRIVAKAGGDFAVIPTTHLQLVQEPIMISAYDSSRISVKKQLTE